MNAAEQRARDLAELRAITARIMADYPHAPPHPETVEAYAAGYLHVLEVSRRRPAAYASEPWLTRSAWHHTRHAWDHTASARGYLERYGSGQWSDEDGTPNLAHAAARCFLAIAQHDRGFK